MSGFSENPDMSRSTQKNFRIPHALWDSIEALRSPGKPLADYPSLNVAIVGILLNEALFPRDHGLTAALSVLRPDCQDIVHDYAHHALTSGIDLRGVLSDPPTAKDLLEKAFHWAKRPCPLFSGDTLIRFLRQFT